MLGMYFSGTGNTKYCVEKFLEKCGSKEQAVPIENNQVVEKIKKHEEIVIGYSVQYSNIPKMLRDFIDSNKDLWRNKRVFIIATMGLFSGDGAGMLARLLTKYGAVVIGGLHLKMPDSIGDEKALKRPLDDNRNIIRRAEQKIEQAAIQFGRGEPTKDGLGIWSHLAGLFGQRLYFYNKTKGYTDKLKINTEKCIGCGKCAELCPMNNITMRDNKAVADGKCTMCYRCVNNCPKQAITLLGTKVVEQSRIEKYLS